MSELRGRSRVSDKKCDCESQMIAGLVAGVILGIVIGSAFFAVSYPMLQSGKWAAWVQAIGSILGISVAIAVPAWQHRKAEDLRSKHIRLHNFRVLRLLSVLSERAFQQANTVGAARSKSGRTEKAEDRIKQRSTFIKIAEEVDAIPLLEVPTYEAVEYFARLKQFLGEAIDEVGDVSTLSLAIETGEPYGKPWYRLRGNLSEIRDIFLFQSKSYGSSDIEPSLIGEINGDY